MKGGPLSAMPSSITTVDYGNGLKFDALLVEHCAPCALAGKDHSHMIPFSIHGPSVVDNGERGTIRVWRHVSGTTIDDITLAPSYLVQGCGVHGFVRQGRWEPC